MEPEVHKKPLRFYEIDLLRFLAAIAVVFHHYAFLSYQFSKHEAVHYPPLSLISKYGFLGVELFFIISGYVVLMSAYNKTVKQFFLSRVTRLYPAFWVCCTLTFIVAYAATPTGGTHPGVGQYIYNMTMLQDFFGAVSLDGVYWTLTKEIVFYFLVAVLVGFGLIPYLDKVLLLWLLYTALAGPNHPDNNGFSQLFIPAYSPFFAAGMIFFMLQNRMYAAWKLYGLLLLSLALAMRSLFFIKGQYVEVCHTDFSFPVMASVVFLFFVLFGLIVFRVISLQNATWLAKLGALTYPVYLLHDNIGALFLDRYSTVDNKYYLLIAMIFIMLLAAYAVHELIEKRIAKPLGAQVSQLLAYLDTK